MNNINRAKKIEGLYQQINEMLNKDIDIKQMV